MDFAPIRAPLEESEGITAVTGTLEIGFHGDNPSSLDPLLNASLWKRSQTVRLQVANDAGTLIDHPFGYLFILQVPALSADGQFLSVEVGDYLALSNRRDLPGDQSGVTLGTALDYSVICQNYLEAAGIPSGNINLGGPWGYAKALPIPKDGVNALTMAGQVAYAADFRVLYQDHDGIVRAEQVTVTPATPDLSFNAATLPVEWFEREFELATAPELVKVTATGETVSTISTPINDTPTNTADLEIYTEKSYELSQAFIGIDSGNLSGRRAVDPNRHALRIKRRRERRPGEQVFETGGSSIKVTTEDTTEYYYYECLPGNADGVFPYRLIEKWTTIDRAKGITDGDDNATNETYRIIAEGWSFDDDGVMTDHNIATYARQKEYEPDGTFGLQWRLIEQFDEVWTEESTNAYEYDSITQSAAITQSQSFNANNTANKWQLRTVDSENRPAEKTGDNSPPAADLWEGPYAISEEVYEGEATYTPPGGASSVAFEDVKELPDGLGISNAVCSSIAGKWAQIYGGKQYAMGLTIPISDALLALDRPLWQVAYTVDGRVRTYLVDAQAYNHTSDQTICEALGILIGDVAA